MKKIQQPKWKKLEYSKGQILKAGRNIKKGCLDLESEKVLNNWRASHAFPMHVIYIHLRRFTKNKSNIIVAERLKRKDSIINKLEREPFMSLWEMQDIGGCRMVVPPGENVYEYFEKYDKSRKRHIKIRVKDYIKNPKEDGYRSLHAVYKYHSDKREDYNRNMLIEIQFRSRLQHAWATAVETMGTFKREAIKAGGGSRDIRRFFALVSSLFAILEGQPCVPNTPSSKEELIKEIKELDIKNQYLEFLSGVKSATQANKDKKFDKNAAYAILKLNYEEKKLNIILYQSSDFLEANKKYDEIEQTREKDKTDAVLVRVSSIKQLNEAYPNYYLDITGFVEIVRDQIYK
ncbi:RelA/SpoT domain-containing protein [bacterium]|nr:RelA/SpoT domain-containing protein [bacterium]